MKKTRVVHCKKEEYDVYIGRGTVWGNPFKIGKDGTRKEVLDKYEKWVVTQPKIIESLHLLKGKILDCWCKPYPCHGDILVRLIDEKVYDL